MATEDALKKENGINHTHATDITYSTTAAQLSNGDNDPALSRDLTSATKPSSVHEDSLIPVPPLVPSSGISIQVNKLWIGNLDKRLTE